METTAERRRGGWKHGVRNPHAPEPAITSRDVLMLDELFHNRLMHVGQLQALFGAKVDERLRRLFDAGFIDWPDAQKMWRHPGVGSRPNVYALSDRGAAVLVEAGVISEVKATRWAENNHRLKSSSLFLPHTLAVNDVKVAFRLACRRRGLRYVPGHMLVHSGSARALTIPGRKKPMWTDDTFTIERVGKEPALFFSETDCDSETNVPGVSADAWDTSSGWTAARHTDVSAESLLWKTEGYFAYARARHQVEQFGIRNFRTLTITTGSEKRVLNIAAATHIGCHGVEVRRYLTTNFAALALADPFAAPWFDASGSLIQLAL